jgi:long-subunit fatty acid transport protein
LLLPKSLRLRYNMRTALKSAPLVGQIIGLLLMPVAVASAQTSLQVPVQFDFLNPGARSMSLGSAFVALADDATAAFTNPAGLDRLVKPEISFEARGRRFENTFLQGGRLSGTPSGLGVDTQTSPVYGISPDTSKGLSFLSVVYPGRRWAVAGYRHELVRVNESFVAQGAFLAGNGPGGVPTNNIRELPVQAARDLKITTYGGSLGIKVNNKVSIGGGVTVAQFEVAASFLRFTPPADFFGAPDYSASRQFQLVTQDGKNTGVGVNIGALLKATPKVQFGAVYRRAPHFSFATKSTLISPPIVLNAEDGIRFQAPDVLSLGASIRPNESLLITAEYDFVQYSMIMERFVTHVSAQTKHPEGFGISDSNEIHGGVEWAFTKMKRTPSIRLGAWYDPEHAVSYTRSAANDGDDQLFSAYLPKRKALTHFTIGAGLPVNDRFEINAGFDVSSRTRLGSVSAVVRF